ncbi:MAG: squalene/phytoene synthase family protein [Alphaproteobacteria bacterium]|nr:squalene/phytoene synthase family protein [Alphaproteobacteria bacterium]
MTNKAIIPASEPATDQAFNAWKNQNTENFPVGSFLIRAALRPHVHAFYAFARAADNISDDPLMDAAEKIRRLNQFALTLGNADCTKVPEAALMRQSLTATRISPRHCLDLLTAFKRDATQLRYQNWDELLDYCRYSAAPVGRYVLALHGIGEAAWPANDALCAALQIINHIQDCADDYRELDRAYIPEDMLLMRGANLADLSAVKCTEPLRLTLQDMLDRLKPLMTLAHSFPGQIRDVRLKLEVSVIVALADDMIACLRRRDPLAEETKLGKGAVIWAALRRAAGAWF